MAKVITSLQNPLVKEWVKLRESKSFRQERGECLISGAKQIAETPSPKLLLVYRTSLIPKNYSGQIVRVSQEVLQKATGLKNPDGIAAVVPLPAPARFQKTRRLLALDGVADPGNLGTLLRTALAFGWEGVFCLPGCADPFGDKALRAAKGATFHIPIEDGPFARLLQIVENSALLPLAADALGKPFKEIDKSLPLVLILGAEGKGLSEKTQKIAQNIAIPMEGRVESLNVAVAGAILLYGLNDASA